MVCLCCDRDFDSEAEEPATPELEIGMLLARERYGDFGRVCAECLANRGRLALMYDCDFRR